MSLFRVSTRGLIPFRVVTDEMETQSDIAGALIEALWSDLDAVTDLTLMPVRRGAADDDAAPIIVALDTDGNIVVLYAESQVDSTGLALCLEHVGWARGVTVSELASDYWRGSDDFWRDWQDFSGTASPWISDTGPRIPALFIVTTAMTSSAEAALDFLTDAGVPARLLRAAIYADDHGCQLLELGSRPSSARMPASTQSRRDVGSEPAPAGPAGSAPLTGYRASQAAIATPKARETVDDVPAEVSSQFVDISSPAMTPGDRQVSPGRGIDVGSMNRAVADELFSGSDPQRQQSRFARPPARALRGATPRSGPLSQLRRKQHMVDDVAPQAEAGDDSEQSHDSGAAPAPFTRHGDRRSQNSNPSLSPPELAPLRFPGGLAEPALPEELLGSIGSMTGNGSSNGAGNGRGSHSA